MIQISVIHEKTNVLEGCSRKQKEFLCYTVPIANNRKRHFSYCHNSLKFIENSKIYRQKVFMGVVRDQRKIVNLHTDFRHKEKKGGRGTKLEK